MQCKSPNPVTVKIVSALVQKMSTPEKVGGQNTGIPSTSKSRGTHPHPPMVVEPWVDGDVYPWWHNS